MEIVPASFANFISDMFEGEGVQWLESLPALIAEFGARWSFTAEPPFPNLSYNYVAPVTRSDGRAAVLKLGVPRDELLTEIEALRLYDGRGSVQLLESDPEAGAMLLERVRPGEMLSEVAEEDDEAATVIAAELMKRLWRPAPEEHPFPTVADWGKGMVRLRNEFGGGTGPFPKALVEEAEGLYRELMDSAEAPVVLHGDFHHWNVMTAEREPWLAIDPKGLVGEPAYEVGPLLYNPLGFIEKQPNPVKVMARRINILAEHLGVDRERIVGWGVYECVLSGWWSYEDQGYGWGDDIEIARILKEIGRGNL